MKKRNTKSTVRQYVTHRQDRPEIGHTVVIASGYPKRHISATITGVVELNGTPVQFVVMPENGTFERHIYLAEVASYVWNIPAIKVPAAANHYAVQ